MKTANNLALAVLSAALLLTSAQAAANKQANITLGATTEINSQQIQSGDYKIRWAGTGSLVQVEILQGKKVVASSTAKVVPQTTAVDHNQVILLMQDNGTRKLRRIDVPRQKVSLVFQDNQASGQ
jgi:opacity protein-like surface antigen